MLRVWLRWPKPGPLAAGRGSHLLGLSLSGGEVPHQDPLRLKCGLTLGQCVRLNRGSGSLTVVPPLAQRWAVECKLAPAALHDERDVARKGGLLPPALHSWCCCEELLGGVLYHGLPLG
jgi:hypothetical protein